MWRICTLPLTCFSNVWLCVILRTAVCQAPLSMEFSRQEYWSGLRFPYPGDLPNPGIKPRFPALQADSLQLSHQGSPTRTLQILNYKATSPTLSGEQQSPCEGWWFSWNNKTQTFRCGMGEPVMKFLEPLDLSHMWNQQVHCIDESVLG